MARHHDIFQQVCIPHQHDDHGRPLLEPGVLSCSMLHHWTPRKEWQLVAYVRLCPWPYKSSKKSSGATRVSHTSCKDWCPRPVDAQECIPWLSAFLNIQREENLLRFARYSSARYSSHCCCDQSIRRLEQHWSKRSAQIGTVAV